MAPPHAPAEHRAQDHNIRQRRGQLGRHPDEQPARLGMREVVTHPAQSGRGGHHDGDHHDGQDELRNPPPEMTRMQLVG